MDSLPTTLIESLPAELVSDAELWWHSLSKEDRDELWRLCDSRKNLFLFETFSGDDAAGKVTGGKFIPGANEFGIEDWGEDYFQHLLAHPELMIVFEPAQRTFHIGCSRHIMALRCFVDGAISESFSCPFTSGHCLMHKILGTRTSVKLRPYSRWKVNG